MGNQLTLQQVIDPKAQTITVVLTYQGDGWLSYGVPQPGSYNRMEGADVVIGQPGQGAPQKWNIGYGMSQSALSLSSAQTLTGASITQSNGVTTLKYTKKLVESGELSISSSGSQEFIWAVGYSNQLSMHQYRGWFSTQVPQCSGAGGTTANAGSLISGGAPAASQNLWVLHGLLMLLAWALCVPLAIGASLLRDLMPEGTWFTLHRFLNTFAFGAAIIAFLVAVYQVS